MPFVTEDGRKLVVVGVKVVSLAIVVLSCDAIIASDSDIVEFSCAISLDCDCVTTLDVSLVPVSCIVVLSAAAAVVLALVAVTRFDVIMSVLFSVILVDDVIAGL